jgi:hypothetical protein
MQNSLKHNESTKKRLILWLFLFLIEWVYQAVVESKYNNLKPDFFVDAAIYAIIKVKHVCKMLQPRTVSIMAA